MVAREMSRLLVSCVLLACACLHSSAGTIQYRMRVNGLDTQTLTADTLTPGQVFTLSIEANVPDVDFGGGIHGGMLQGSFDLLEPEAYGDHLQPVFEESQFTQAGTTTTDRWWVASAPAGLTEYTGMANEPSSRSFGLWDVKGHTVSLPPTDFSSQYDAFGAGPDVWSEICTGQFVWDGEATALQLFPAPLGGQLIYGSSGEAEYPEAACGWNLGFGESADMLDQPAILSPPAPEEPIDVQDDIVYAPPVETETPPATEPDVPQEPVNTDPPSDDLDQGEAYLPCTMPEETEPVETGIINDPDDGFSQPIGDEIDPDEIEWIGIPEHEDIPAFMSWEDLVSHEKPDDTSWGSLADFTMVPTGTVYADSYQIPAQNPEPASGACLLLSLIGLVRRRRRA